MGETVEQLEEHIDRTRKRLGSNLKELEHKVDTATDWREQYRARPYAALAAVFAGGAVLAAILRPAPGRHSFDRSEAFGTPVQSGPTVKGQALELWDNMQHALVGVAATRLKDYVGEMVPGFAEHMQRFEQRQPRTSL